MRYLALACDYDGTLAADGRVTEETVAALERLLASGRKLILVTGRRLEDLLSVFPAVHLFERVVAENGAVLYRPASRELKVLCAPPPEEFLWRLRERGVWPLSTGHAIVATNHPHETTVLEVIRDLGLELHVIFNKGAVMVLPTGVNKATGLAAALDELRLSPHNVVGVGDAENDHAFLRLCEYAVAVANALPMLKGQADLVTAGDHGAGVGELIDLLVADDLRRLESGLTRHHLVLGAREDGQGVRIDPQRVNILLAGVSGGGKSTFATGFLERLAERQYQFCVIDPEGDYEGLGDAVVLGNSQQPANVAAVLQLLDNPQSNAVVNLLGLPLADRPGFFQSLLPRLQELRARTGRPHWILVDETHHLLSSAWEPAPLTLPQEFSGMLFITVHPGSVSPVVLSSVDVVVAVGQQAAVTVQEFCTALAQPPPGPLPPAVPPGHVLVWRRHADTPPFLLRPAPSRTERRRHRRKYAEGELGPDRSFYFRGPEGKLNLRAQNLVLFQQLAEGVDDETWLYHLRQGDYSRWLRETIKDNALADEVRRIEAAPHLSAAESRARLKAAIAERYTLPASGPEPSK
ncbi:MAG: HAD-IIB family hydrolase [Thermodesulfobacteriota bacterium]|jgi:hydroxymethylpyrimidine pyrophosphatase-like HAD family hydrolase